MPQFDHLISTVLEKIAHIAEIEPLQAGMLLQINESYWYLMASGDAIFNEDISIKHGDELGYKPFAESQTGKLSATSDCQLFKIPKDKTEQLILDVPQFAYLIRKYRIETNMPGINWFRGKVEIQ